jgi:hypothetical protein
MISAHPENPMLDVHPPHQPTHTWRDFFIHIATIVIGLLIAIGLEQTVEAIHHHHQRAELTEQMRTEAEHNVAVLQKDIDRILGEYRYVEKLGDALRVGKVTANGVDVQGVPSPGISVTITSPSRATWQAAQAAGIISLLPPEQAKLYARADFNAGEEQSTEDLMVAKLGELASECARAGYDHSSTAVSHITLSERKDLLYKLDQLNNALALLGVYMAVTSGADQAIVAGASSIDQMYPYQEAALGKIYGGDIRPSSAINFFGGVGHPQSGTNFYGGSGTSR